MFTSTTSAIYRIRIKICTKLRKWRRGVARRLEAVRQKTRPTVRRVGRRITCIVRKCWASPKFRRLLAEAIPDIRRKLVRRAAGSPWFALADMVLIILADNLERP